MQSHCLRLLLSGLVTGGQPATSCPHRTLDPDGPFHLTNVHEFGQMIQNRACVLADRLLFNCSCYFLLDRLLTIAGFHFGRTFRTVQFVMAMRFPVSGMHEPRVPIQNATRVKSDKITVIFGWRYQANQMG